MKPLLLVLSGLLLAACAGPAADYWAAGREGQAAAAKAPTYQNPVLDADFPDPQVMKAKDGYFYAYATQTLVDGRWENVPAARSRDLVRWERLPDAMPTRPSWASETQNFWAPHVEEVGGRYVMYLSAEPNARKGLAIGVAVADSPRGPFVATDAPMVTGGGFEHIDPQPFTDPKSGKRYLYWGSGFQPIRVRELAADGLRFAPGSQAINVVMPERKRYEHLVEGAFVVLRDGWYVMYYSGDSCCVDDEQLREPTYAVSVARSRSPLGPFEKLAAAKGRADSVILKRSERWLAPGHNAIVTDDAGRDWMIYHAIDPKQRRIPGTDMARRPLLIDPVVYEDGWPRIDGGVPSDERRRGPVFK